PVPCTKARHGAPLGAPLRPLCPTQALPRRLLPQDRLHAREIAARGLQLRGRIELRRRLLEPHPEQRLVELALANPQGLDAQFPQLSRLHDHGYTRSCAKRVANLVSIGSFAAANCIARRASVSGTPSISNRIRPGLITATHCSGAPLPLPMRVSCGFLVIGFSGETPVPIFPPRLIKPVIAIPAPPTSRSVNPP